MAFNKANRKILRIMWVIDYGIYDKELSSDKIGKIIRSGTGQEYGRKHVL